MPATRLQGGDRQPTGATAACSAAPVKRADYRAPTRGCRSRPTLSPVGAVAPAAEVAAPWQGDYQRARAAAACVAATATQKGKEGLRHPLEKRTI
ncbi:hypothetical protein GW17_00057496, partial [Ensete ventricosum]